MATAGPRRRSSDTRRPVHSPSARRPATSARPTRTAWMRSLEFALEARAAAPAPDDARRDLGARLPSRRTTWRGSRPSCAARCATPTGCGGTARSSLILLLTDADGPNSEPALARLRMRLKAEGLVGHVHGPRGAGAGHRRPDAAGAGARRPAPDRRAAALAAGERPMRVAVAGATGLIGGRLCQALLGRGDEVVVLVARRGLRHRRRARRPLGPGRGAGAGGRPGGRRRGREPGGRADRRQALDGRPQAPGAREPHAHDPAAGRRPGRCRAPRACS